MEATFKRQKVVPSSNHETITCIANLGLALAVLFWGWIGSMIEKDSGIMFGLALGVPSLTYILTALSYIKEGEGGKIRRIYRLVCSIPCGLIFGIIFEELC